MAEERMVPMWFAFDGKGFPTKAECEAHERDHFQIALVGLTAEKIAAAVARDPDVRAISDALERAGSLIARARLAEGERKRARNGASKGATPAEEPTRGPPADGSAVVDDELT